MAESFRRHVGCLGRYVEAMESLETRRLLLRRFRTTDAAAYAAYRSDEMTAKYQSWVVPYPLDRAQADVDAHAAMDGPIDDAWFGLAITDAVTETVVGDVVMQLSWKCRSAEVGYTLDPAHRGHGYATEALTKVIEYLFDDRGVTRIHAALHPENVASMRVLERCGFVYEGTARQAYWVGDACTDDASYGLLRADWDAWRTRPRTRPTNIELVEVTHENLNDVSRLATHHSQRRFVSPMSRSFANLAHPEPDPAGGPTVPWYRAISADGLVVGFVMVAEPSPTSPHPYLWRLLIDRLHQQRGIGGVILSMLVERYREQGCSSIEVSWADGQGSPRPFYERHGFTSTGRLIDGEVEGVRSM